MRTELEFAWITGRDGRNGIRVAVLDSFDLHDERFIVHRSWGQIEAFSVSHLDTGARVASGESIEDAAQKAKSLLHADLKRFKDALAEARTRLKEALS